MIVNNPPTFGEAFEDECEASVRLIVCAFQAPAAQRDRRIGRKHRDFNLRKSERPHLRPIGIFCAISFADCFPTACDFAF